MHAGRQPNKKSADCDQYVKRMQSWLRTVLVVFYVSSVWLNGYKVDPKDNWYFFSS